MTQPIEGKWRVSRGDDGSRYLYLFTPRGYCAIVLDEGEDTCEKAVACSRVAGDDADAWVWSTDGFESLLDELERRPPQATNVASKKEE